MFDTPQAPQQQGGSSKNGRHEHASKPPQQQGGFPQKWQTRECLAALTATGRLHPKMADMSVSKPAAGGLNAAPADFLFTQCAEELRDQSTLYCLGPSPTALCVRLSPAGSAAPAGVSARQQERPLRTCVTLADALAAPHAWSPGLMADGVLNLKLMVAMLFPSPKTGPLCPQLTTESAHTHHAGVRLNQLNVWLGSVPCFCRGPHQRTNCPQLPAPETQQ
eukprot:1157618-Pelagomonas_calceolata.AAC.2